MGCWGWRWGLVLGCLLTLLAGCGMPLELEEERGNLGAERPEAIANAFFRSMNEALQDPDLSEPEVRRIWSERLASYFAPSERVDLRYDFRQMLARFAAGRDQVSADQELTAEIVFSGVQVTERNGARARVHLQDGALRYRRVRVDADGYRTVLADEQRPLADALGQADGSFPVLQVNGRWFMTGW